MARKPQKPAEITAATGPAPDAHALTRADEAEIQDTESAMAFDAARMLGQIEALEFTRNISDLTQVQIFLNLKKNKAYRAITYRDSDGNTKRISDLDEFCERYLKKSHRRMQQLAANYHMLGADLYETAERIGFRAQDYTALKALPADDQAVIKQAIEAEDHDTVISLMQELAAKHQAEKAVLQAEAAEAQETAEARDQVVKAKEAKISQLEEAHNKLKRRVAKATPDEVALEIRKEASLIAFEAEHAVRANLAAAFEMLTDHGGVAAHSEYMLGLITQIELALGVLRADYGLLKAAPDGDPTPHWMRDAAGGVQ